MDKESQDQLNQEQAGQSVPGKAGSPDSSKRRLLKGAVTAAPVVMAVSSKPALARFCTVSGFLSGNLSNNNTGQHCGGRSPGYWINHCTKEMQHTTFLEVFGDVWHGDMGDWPRNHHTPTLYDVLKMTGNEDRYQFGAHAVAAYQNALEFSGYPMSIYDVGAIVSEVLQYGYYTHPVTGRTLDAQEVVDFFYQTFDA